tara:strand:- start:46 stop:558 length:513 start_codon:yes stop_codon:yes gene_type:complete
MGINKQLGGVTDFIRTAETQPGNQATDLEFTNTFGGDTIFIMRGNGEPTSSADTKSFVNYGFVGTRFYRVSRTISGSASASIDATTNSQVYDATLDTGYQIKNGSTMVSVNGLELISNTNQSSTERADFFITGSQRTINIRKLYTNGFGIDLTKDDVVNISYQQESTGSF